MEARCTSEVEHDDPRRAEVETLLDHLHRQEQQLQDLRDQAHRLRQERDQLLAVAAKER